jgi:hypothetical protein
MNAAREMAHRMQDDIWHNHPGWSFNKKFAESKKWDEFRMNAMKVAFNAEQFNRRAAFIRKHPNTTEAIAAAMFPASN